MTTATEACGLETAPTAPFEAAEWVADRVSGPGAGNVAMALCTAVLATDPTEILVRITRDGDAVRISAFGSSLVRESDLTPADRITLQTAASRFGRTRGRNGLWAELPVMAGG